MSEPIKEEIKEKEDKKRYVSIKNYAAKCNVSIHAIYMRLTNSDKGIHKPGDSAYLEQTGLLEADGVFIDIKKFPAVTVKKGRRIKNK
jgi:hypothetical protein